MLSIQFERFGEPTEVLQVIDVPVPEPKTNQVLIRMRVRPVHSSDLHIMRGRYGILPPLPISPGLEGMGVIESLGEGVQGFHVGQRVIPFNSWGCWQEYLVADASRLLLVPDTVSDEMAAQLIINPMTAWVMLTQELQVERGEWLVQTAANSAVGRLVIQLSQILGLKTINIVRSREQVQGLLDMGADEVICSADENVVERIAQITGSTGVGKAMDSVAGQVGADVLQSLRFGGVMLQYGALSTHGQTDPGKMILPVFAPKMIYGVTSVRGWWLYSWLSSVSLEEAMGIANQLLSLMAQGRIVLGSGQAFALADAKQAVRYAQQAQRQGGKALLVG